MYMEFKVKIEDIYNFLKNNGYSWQDMQATLPLYDYKFKVTNANLYNDFLFKNELQLFEMLVKNKAEKFIEIDINVNNVKFLVNETIYGKENKSIDLTKNWIEYLLANHKDYSKYLKNWYMNQKTYKRSFYEEKIKMLEQELKDCKKQYVRELKQLSEYKKILSNVKKKQSSEESYNL